MFILTNAFSINMLNRAGQNLTFRPCTIEAVRNLHRNEGGLVSAVGHEDTARILTSVLGFVVPFNRANVVLDGDSSLIVA